MFYSNTQLTCNYVCQFARIQGIEEKVARQITHYNQLVAIKAGVTLDEVLKLTSLQIDAAIYRATIEEALIVGATTEEALFKDGIPFLAKKAGVPETESKLFDDIVQVRSFEAGESVGDILLVNAVSNIESGLALGPTLFRRFKAIDLGATLEQALQIEAEEQFIDFQKTTFTLEQTSFVELINTKFAECEKIRPLLEPTIKDRLIQKLYAFPDISSMKSSVELYFDRPESFNTGRCSKIFMEAISDYPLVGQLAADHGEL